MLTWLVLKEKASIGNRSTFTISLLLHLHQEMENVLPLISVIITTRNESVHIGDCLTSIKNQRYPQENIEIIVVDNNSADATTQIAGEYTSKIFNYGPERSAQRNFGVRQSHGKYILYLDADMILNDYVISECVAKCENEGYAVVYIPERITGEGFWIKVRDFERSFYNATVIDCVRFVRRNVFLEAGGFDETMTGPEDWDFDRKVLRHGKAGVIIAPIYHNEGKFNLKRYLAKKSYYSRAFSTYIQKWGKNDPVIRKQFGFPYRYFGVFCENGKWKKFFGNIPLALGVYFLRALVGSSFVIEKIRRKNS